MAQSLRMIAVVLAIALLAPVLAPPEVEASSSAGLWVGPIDAGGYRLVVTRPHMGYAGPKFGRLGATHVNVHFSRLTIRNKPTDLRNYHVTVHRSGGPLCLYVWDSVKDQVVIDVCVPQGVPERVREIGRAVAEDITRLLSSEEFRTVAVAGLLVLVTATVVRVTVLAPLAAFFRVGRAAAI